VREREGESTMMGDGDEGYVGGGRRQTADGGWPAVVWWRLSVGLGF
jgi:hypothetical protein